jgi:hypothetical protein
VVGARYPTLASKRPHEKQSNNRNAGRSLASCCPNCAIPSTIVSAPLIQISSLQRPGLLFAYHLCTTSSSNHHQFRCTPCYNLLEPSACKHSFECGQCVKLREHHCLAVGCLCCACSTQTVTSKHGQALWVYPESKRPDYRKPIWPDLGLSGLTLGLIVTDVFGESPVFRC